MPPPSSGNDTALQAAGNSESLMPSTGAIGVPGASFAASRGLPGPGVPRRFADGCADGRIFADRGQSDPWSPLVPIQSHGRELPFFWIHGDSSTACLRDHLRQDRPVCALEHQAHDGRPARFTEVETIANTIWHRCAGFSRTDHMCSAAIPSAPWSPSRWLSSCRKCMRTWPCCSCSILQPP